MAQHIITDPQGNKHVINAPDNATPEQVMEYARKTIPQGSQGVPESGPSVTATKPTTEQKFRASWPMRVVQGARDPVDAGAQLLPHALGGVTSGFGLFPNPVSEFFDSEAKRVDDMNANAESEYQAARNATSGGDPGVDVARVVGNIVSPVNAAIAARIPVSATASVPRLAMQGVKAGAVGGLLSPVSNTEDGFWGQKALQTGVGAATGGTLTPVMAKLSAFVASRVNGFLASRNPEIGAKASLYADQAIADALKETGQKLEDIPKQQMQALRQQVVDAMKSGKKLDAAAIMRSKDFESLGMNGLKGQITRDATQFARERNLRGVEGAGEPIMSALEQQNQKLQGLLGNARGNAQEAYPAGKQIIGSLKSVDDASEKAVDAAYKAARAADGRYANVNTKAFSEAANQALDAEMLVSALPTEAKTLLNDISSGKITLNVNTLVQVDKRLSGIARDAAANRNNEAAKAVGIIRTALNNAPIEDAAGVGAKASFDAARGLARQRFSVHDAVPALKAVVDGSADPDTFVNNFIVNGSTDELKALAKVLPPDALKEAKSQIGATLFRAAFGENQAGDKVFSPERYARAMRQLGTDKLRTLFSQQEVDQLKTIGRVGAYINSIPTSAPVNSSNNIGAILGISTKIPGLGPLLSYGGGLAQALHKTATRNMDANAALAAKIPAATPDLSPEQIRRLTQALSTGAVATGALSAPR